jgi:hypothetical protein
MATLYISEYADSYLDQNNHTLSMAVQPPIARQAIAVVTTTSTQSAAFNAKTRYVRLMTDIITGIEFGTNPTGDATSAKLPANGIEYFAVPPNQAYKVATFG